MDANIIMGVVIFLLVLLSALFSAMETAFSFANKIRIQQSAEDGNKRAKTAQYIIDRYDNALTAILICNNIVNLGCSSIATVLCLNIFGDIGSAIATGATTLLVLTFGEVIPKCLAKVGHFIIRDSVALVQMTKHDVAAERFLARLLHPAPPLSRSHTQKIRFHSRSLYCLFTSFISLTTLTRRGDPYGLCVIVFSITAT